MTGAVFRGAPLFNTLIDRISTVAATVIATVTYYTNISTYQPPLYFFGDDPIVVQLSGAAATAQIYMRVEGYRRQL
jgi:hypothetical protein